MMLTRPKFPTANYIRYTVRWHVAGRRDLNPMCCTTTGRVMGGELW